jgi:hypothetical protein
MNRPASTFGVALVLALAACGGGEGPQPEPFTTIEGTVTIQNSLDWKALVDSGCTTITGSLVVAAPGLVGPLNFPTLRSIGGGVSVFNNNTLTSFSFPALTTLRNLSVWDNNALTSFSLPALTTLSVEFYVLGNPSLPECFALAFKNHLVAAHGFAGNSIIKFNDVTATCP